MVKVISLSNEAYGKLRALKGDRSFSEVVIHLVEKKKAKGKKENLMKFFGIFKDRADEWENIEKRIYEDRAKFKLREYKW